MKRNAELFFPAEFADDFPVSLQVSTAVHSLPAAQQCRTCCSSWWQQPGRLDHSMRTSSCGLLCAPGVPIPL